MSQERYQPTRLEWLVLSIETKIPMLLSQMRMLQNLRSVDDVRVFFKAKEPDTVSIIVRHLDGVSPDMIKILNGEIQRELMEIAKYHGWDAWVKISWDTP